MAHAGRVVQPTTPGRPVTGSGRPGRMLPGILARPCPVESSGDHRTL